MKVTQSEQDGVAILHLVGEFDSFETRQVRESFEGCIAAGTNNVVMDLFGMSFANSTTIAFFISAQNRAASEGGRVILAQPMEFMRKTLQTLGLHRVFTIVDSVDEAISTIKLA